MTSLNYDLLAEALLRAQSNANPIAANFGGRLTAATAETELAVGSAGGEEKAHAGVQAVAKGPTAAGAGAKFRGEDVVTSWADEVTDSEVGSGSSVASGGVPPAAGDAVRRMVKFGGQSMDEEVDRVQVADEESFYKTVVRGGHAVALFKRLEVLGIKVPRHARAEMALCAYTAGTMPPVAVEGKNRLKSLAAVGDAALTLHLVNDSYHKGRVVENVQAYRSKYTNDRHLNDVLIKLKLHNFISFPPGVDAATSKAGATALEAIIGVLSIHVAPRDVSKFLRNNGVYAS